MPPRVHPIYAPTVPHDPKLKRRNAETQKADEARDVVENRK